MLPWASRLRRGKDIQAVLKNGNALRTPYVRVHLQQTTRGYSRFACVVSSRVSSSAVARHRYQRWLRHAAQEVVRDGALQHSYDMVWYALPAIDQGVTYRDVVQSLKVALARRQL